MKIVDLQRQLVVEQSHVQLAWESGNLLAWLALSAWVLGTRTGLWLMRRGVIPSR